MISYEHYFDWAATAPGDEEILKAALAASLEHWGNPSSIHAAGADAREALEAAKKLEAEGIEAAVIDPVTVKPLDVDLIRSWAEKTGAVVTCENHNRIGGLTSAVEDALIGMPLIFLERDGDSLYTGMKTTGEVFEEHELRKEDLPHIISMAFPDVRLKQYLEIRAADSLPADYIPGYLALVQGLMYSEKVLDHVQEQIRVRQISGDKVRETEQSLIQDGFEGYIYGVCAADFAEEAISLAGEELGAYEREAIGRLAKLPLHGPANCKSAEKRGFWHMCESPIASISCYG